MGVRRTGQGAGEAGRGLLMAAVYDPETAPWRTWGSGVVCAATSEGGNAGVLGILNTQKLAEGACADHNVMLDLEWLAEAGFSVELIRHQKSWRASLQPAPDGCAAWRTGARPSGSGCPTRSRFTGGSFPRLGRKARAACSESLHARRATLTAGFPLGERRAGAAAMLSRAPVAMASAGGYEFTDDERNLAESATSE